jgi:signal transduction histidine kinase
MKKLVGSLVAFCVVLTGLAYAGAFSFLLSTNYLPHQFCYLLQPGLVWTNVTMDGLIAAAYVAIFAALFWMAFRLRAVKELRGYLWIFFAFGSFIIACAFTHMMEVVTVWWPAYRLAAATKVLCVLASVPTAILFLRVVPGLTANMSRFMVMLTTTQQEKDQALASLIAVEKLAVAGRIAASIAQEIKNPLETVGNLLYLLRTDPNVPMEMVSLVETAQGEILRAGHIAQSTLSLYRGSSRPALIELGPLLQSVLDLQSDEFDKHHIRVGVRINAPLPMVGYPSEIRQILINLLQNASAAIGEHGTILVRVQPSRSGYRITVADTGSGIHVSHRGNLFTLFFTTRSVRGAGLGLWLVQSLVAKHGGRIRFRSRTAQESAVHGTIFTLWLPLGSPVERPALAAIASEGALLSLTR